MHRRILVGVVVVCGASVGLGGAASSAPTVDWPQFVVSGLLWFVLPLALGINRVLRAEVK